MDFIKTIPLKDLPSGKIKRVMAGKTPVLLINKEGKIYSTQADCTHEHLPLEEGHIEGKCTLVCPHHQAKFDISTGRVDPDTDWATDLQTHETKVTDGIIYVKL